MSLTIRQVTQASMNAGLRQGLRVSIIDCNPPLVPFFSGLGYDIHRDDLVHPEYGAVFVMKMDARNRQRLADCRSPFLRVLDAFQATQESATV